MIEHGNRKDSVCIDHLKPAYLNETLPEHTNPCNHTSNRPLNQLHMQLLGQAVVYIFQIVTSNFFSFRSFFPHSLEGGLCGIITISIISVVTFTSCQTYTIVDTYQKGI